MFLSLIAGIVAFVLTVFAMPHFIRIYQLKKLVDNKCTRMSNSI
ncbi:Phospho-N-acetylmuramoyl-pentapeptide-transferase [Streptococcus sp. HSISB1]|nr:Phospho-N-acetylmuramoyl-pentapeptide-transferase [Streptococcus sp. HSISB1]